MRYASNQQTAIITGYHKFSIDNCRSLYFKCLRFFNNGLSYFNNGFSLFGLHFLVF